MIHRSPSSFALQVPSAKVAFETSWSPKTHLSIETVMSFESHVMPTLSASGPHVFKSGPKYQQLGHEHLLLSQKCEHPPFIPSPQSSFSKPEIRQEKAVSFTTFGLDANFGSCLSDFSDCRSNKRSAISFTVIKIVTGYGVSRTSLKKWYKPKEHLQFAYLDRIRLKFKVVKDCFSII